MARHRRPLFWWIEIANEVPKSGARLDPIIIGISVSSLPRWSFDSAQLLRAWSSQEVDRSPATLACNCARTCCRISLLRC